MRAPASGADWANKRRKLVQTPVAVIANYQNRKLGGAPNAIGAVRDSGTIPAARGESGTLAESPLERIAQSRLDL